MRSGGSPKRTTTTTTKSPDSRAKNISNSSSSSSGSRLAEPTLHHRHTTAHNDGSGSGSSSSETDFHLMTTTLPPRAGGAIKAHSSDLADGGGGGGSSDHGEHQHRDKNAGDRGRRNEEPDGLMTTAATTTTTNATCAVPDEGNSDFWQTFAGVAGNMLEWYDFSIFGYLDDVIGEVFFPPGSNGDAGAFLVFGGAFLMRPVGGLLLGYLGDTVGRKKALVVSIFLMAFPTFAMGLLPGYKQIGNWAVVLLILVRLLQGLSVGGQLMSSLVFTLENHHPSRWGLFGSFVMAAANFGTLLGGIVGFALREMLTHDQLVSWGWRVPFLSGIVVSFSGFYLKGHGGDHDGHHYHPPFAEDQSASRNGASGNAFEGDNIAAATTPPENPIRQAFARENLRPLLASSLVPMLWSAGFYLSFVWMSIFMSDLIDNPVPGAFGVNSASLFFSVCLLFPLAGILSDRYGRLRIMTIGGIGMGVLSPVVVTLIGRGMPFLAFFSQCILGVALSLWGAPMCAWLVESFEPDARLTSVSIGYNLAQAIAGGSTPFLATILADKYGPKSPGFVLTALAVISLFGLLFVAPPPPIRTGPGSDSRQTNFQSVRTAANAGTVNGNEFEMVEQSHSTALTSEENELI